jgi:hypothetical protein
MVCIGNDWSRALFDGPFYRAWGGFRAGDLPATSLVFVQSADGNTALRILHTWGGNTDLHLIYEGLSRIEPTP